MCVRFTDIERTLADRLYELAAIPKTAADLCLSISAQKCEKPA